MVLHSKEPEREVDTGGTPAKSTPEALRLSLPKSPKKKQFIFHNNSRTEHNVLYGIFISKKPAPHNKAAGQRSFFIFSSVSRIRL